MATLEDIYKLTISGNYKDMGELIKNAIDAKVHPNDIVNKALSPAMIEVGDKFGLGELYMPDMLLAAKAMQTAMEVIKPLLKGDEALIEKGTVIIGTVKGDSSFFGSSYHDSGQYRAAYKGS